MKTRDLFLPFALALSIGLAGCATKNSVGNTEKYWSQKVSRVKIGMTRGEVDKILPAWPVMQFRNQANQLGAPEVSTITGSGEIVTYSVSQDWRVTVNYDLNGGAGSINNRVRAPVRLTEAPFAP